MRIVVIRSKGKRGAPGAALKAAQNTTSGAARDMTQETASGAAPLASLRFEAISGAILLCAVLGAMLCAAPFRSLAEREGIAAAGASVRRRLETIPVVASALGLEDTVTVNAEPLGDETGGDKGIVDGVRGGINDPAGRGAHNDSAGSGENNDSAGQGADALSFSYLAVSASAYIASPPVRAFAPRYPVNAAIVSGFSWRDDPLYDGTGARYDYHTGIDLAVVVGTPVLACADGVVTETGVDASRGLYLVVDHGGGWESVCCHLFEIHCGVADEVKQGAELALSGQSGKVTGAHLHFELRHDGVPVDPTDYLR